MLKVMVHNDGELPIVIEVGSAKNGPYQRGKRYLMHPRENFCIEHPDGVAVYEVEVEYVGYS